MISHKHKFIHIHIPKCAGTTIEKVFGHFDGHTGRNGQDHRSIRMIQQPWLTRNSISSISNFRELIRRARHKSINKTNFNNHQQVTREQFETYFKFTIVRNPYSRIVSWYRSLIRDQVLLNYLKISSDIELKDYLKKFLHKSYMLKQQVYWLQNFDGKIDLDYIGKFENLESVFHKISKKFSLKNFHFPHEKKSNKIDYRKYYDDEIIDLVTKYYKDDLKTFDYKFD